jgi:hypothetical protein
MSGSSISLVCKSLHVCIGVRPDWCDHHEYEPIAVIAIIRWILDAQDSQDVASCL